MNVAARGPEIRTLSSSRIPYKLRVGDGAGGAVDYTSVQDAINYAISQTPTAANPWTIDIYPGTYDEPLTMGDHVNLLGVGERSAILIQTAAGDIITVGNVTCMLSNLKLDHSGGGTGACIAITNAGADILLEDCHIVGMPAAVHVIEMVAGELRFDDCEITAGDIDLSTAACTLTAHFTLIFNGDIDLAGAFDHALELHFVDMHGGDISNAATGAVDIDLRYVSDIGTFTDAGTAGTVLLEYSVATTATKSGTSPWISRVSDLFILSNTDAEPITCFGGLINTITRAIGPIVWYKDGETLRVLPSGNSTDTVIQWAINAAVAGDTIEIAEGTYTEALVFDAAADVLTLVGDSTDKVIITVVNGTTVTITDCGPVCFESLTLQGTAMDTDYVVYVNANASPASLTLRKVKISGARTGTNAYGIYTLGTNNVVVILDGVKVVMTGEATTYGVYLICTGGTNTLDMNDCYISAPTEDLNAADFVTARCNHSTFATGGISAADDAIVRLKDCSYRAIKRTGTGNIVDESPDLKDAPWHVERWDWQAALANAQVAVRGNPVDAGSGQIQLEVTDNVAGQEAVESLPVVAGALAVSVLPARTPRCLMQIAHDAFDIHTTAFYGLRHSLDDDIPNIAAEECAGFDWDGANFRAISSDGAAGQFTNLTTPTVDTHVQLEVIIFGGVEVEFYVDGILVATHSTLPDGVPDATLDWQHLLETPTGGVGDVIQVTVRPGGVQECPS